MWFSDQRREEAHNCLHCFRGGRERKSNYSKAREKNKQADRRWYPEVVCDNGL